jgi:proteasome lid subunit RPN8/RPN11
MRVRDEYRYLAQVATPEGDPIGSAWLAVDWVPAVQWSHLTGVRSGRLPLGLEPAPAVVEPVWDPRLGPPYVGRFQIRFLRPDAPLEVLLPPATVREAVQAAVAGLVDGARPRPGDPLVYRVMAFPAPRAGCGLEGGGGFEVETRRDAAPVEERSMAALLEAAEVVNATASDPGELPVLIHAAVLEEAMAAAMAAGSNETGGVLLGRVATDPQAGLYLEVTAQVPAREGLADEASFTFLAETWAAVEAALARRAAGERIVGWHHSHPRALWPCAACQCPAEQRDTCPSRLPFFSQKDVHLHRTVFQGAYNVALLLSFQAVPRPRVDLFGWCWHGIAPRAFQLVRGIARTGRGPDSTPGADQSRATGQEAGGAHA